jgi:precorrin-8X/cobalt-precorrin-8 methylmutase
MEWYITDAQALATIDQTVVGNSLSPAEYEIVRRVIYETGDFDYLSSVHFSDKALQLGSAAIAARMTIIVDISMVQVGITPEIRQTFANPVYCSAEAIARPQIGKSKTDWGMQTLAQRYPEAIFLIGESQSALKSLAELIDEGKVKPAFVIATPTSFLDEEIAKSRLQDADIPHICVYSQKGGPGVAVAIFKSLLNLTWLAYGSQGVN